MMIIHTIRSVIITTANIHKHAKRKTTYRYKSFVRQYCRPGQISSDSYNHRIRKGIPMKKLLASAAFVAMAVASGSVYAGDPGAAALNITGDVGATTYLPNPTTTGTPTNANLNGNTVTIATLADDHAHPKASSISVQYSNVVTNYPANIGLFAVNNTLTNGTDNIPYEAQASTSTASLDTGVCTFDSSDPVCKTTGSGEELTDDTVTVTITTAANSGVTVSPGTYSDTLTLKIGTTL